jgi:hypothetical protein
MMEILRQLKDISFQLSTLLLDVCCNQRALVDESGVIRTQMGMHSRLENGSSAWDTVYRPLAVNGNRMFGC